MKKIKTTPEAITHFVKWRQTPAITGQKSSVLMPRRFAVCPPGIVKQQPWPDAKPHQCYSNSHLAPKEWKITSGWMVAPIKTKLGYGKNGKAVYGWVFTSHFWNIDTFGMFHYDGTPFVIPQSHKPRFTERDCFYLQDTEIQDVMFDFEKHGYQFQNVASSFTVLESGEVYSLSIDDEHMGCADFNKGYRDTGWFPFLWEYQTCDENGVMKDDFLEVFKKVIEEYDV